MRLQLTSFRLEDGCPVHWTTAAWSGIPLVPRGRPLRRWDDLVDRQRIELCPNALKGRYVTITPAVRNLVYVPGVEPGIGPL